MDKQDYLEFVEVLKHIRASIESFLLNDPNGKDEQYFKNLIAMIDKSLAAYQQKAEADQA